MRGRGPQRYRQEDNSVGPIEGLFSGYSRRECRNKDQRGMNEAGRGATEEAERARRPRMGW